jgi:hypothetical protein
MKYFLSGKRILPSAILPDKASMVWIPEPQPGGTGDKGKRAGYRSNANRRAMQKKSRPKL